MQNNYKVSQPRLYLAIRIILNSVKFYLPDFTSLKSKYTPQWISDFLDEVGAAEKLPDDQARTLLHESKREDLRTLSDFCLTKWKTLKRYIYEAFAVPDMYYSAAGWNYYDAAANQNFESLKQMMIEGLKFINDHHAELSANGNMPDAFLETFEKTKIDFENMLESFYAAEEQSEVDTVAKISANNDIYAKIIGACLDGQLIFEKEEAKRKQFSFENVCSLISPSVGSGVKFNVVNADTNLPLAGIEITDMATGKKVVTDANGRGEMNQLSSGETTFKLTGDGFNEQEVIVELTGTTKTVDVGMQPLFTGAGVTEKGVAEKTEVPVEIKN